jgi:hypothetical protein
VSTMTPRGWVHGHGKAKSCLLLPGVQTVSSCAQYNYLTLRSPCMVRQTCTKLNEKLLYIDSKLCGWCQPTLGGEEWKITCFCMQTQKECQHFYRICNTLHVHSSSLNNIYVCPDQHNIVCVCVCVH